MLALIIYYTYTVCIKWITVYGFTSTDLISEYFKLRIKLHMLVYHNSLYKFSNHNITISRQAVTPLPLTFAYFIVINRKEIRAFKIFSA